MYKNLRQQNEVQSLDKQIRLYQNEQITRHDHITLLGNIDRAQIWRNIKMEKKNLDWANLGFGYMMADYRYVSNYKDGKWDDGEITTDANITLNASLSMRAKRR